MRASFATAFGAVSLLALIVHAQPQTPRPAFEAASIRENTASDRPVWTPERSGSRTILHRVPLDVVIDYAWHIDNGWQVSFPANMPPGWYDIETVSEGVPDEDQVRLMFRTLLEDRCKMKSHFEMREVPQYNLMVSKAGKLKAPDPDFVPKIDGIPMPFRTGTVGIPVGNDGKHLIGRNAPISELVTSLSKNLRAPVRDMTGITGNFDIDVLIENDPLDASSSAFLIEAVQRELGLKLERTKAPMNVLVVDHLEKPTPN